MRPHSSLEEGHEKLEARAVSRFKDQPWWLQDFELSRCGDLRLHGTVEGAETRVNHAALR